MHAAALRLEMRVLDATSLKSKRGKVRALVGEIRRHHPAIGVAEVDDQDLWQKATLGIAAVAPQASQLERVLRAVEKQVARHHDFELLRVRVAHLEER